MTNKIIWGEKATNSKLHMVAHIVLFLEDENLSQVL